MKIDDIRKVLDCIELINGENSELIGKFQLETDGLYFQQREEDSERVFYEVKGREVYIDGDSRW